MPLETFSLFTQFSLPHDHVHGTGMHHTLNLYIYIYIKDENYESFSLCVYAWTVYLQYVVIIIKGEPPSPHIIKFSLKDVVFV